MSDLFLTGIGELVTNTGSPIAEAVVAVESGIVTYAGPSADAPDQTGQRYDCEGRAVIPGFVDAHTHLVFAGDRSDEFARRLAGESYADIAAAGGGILATVASTRAASEDELYRLAAARVWRMIQTGTTTIEIKSGYGLDLATEHRQLAVARRLGAELPVTVKTTFLGAHSVPPEFRGDRSGYVDLLVEEMLPELSPLADYCDVFVERGVFDVGDARRIFSLAAELGLGARVHAEQLGHTGGAGLAAEIGAVSADHLDNVTEDDANALAAAGVAAVLVPGASYTLRSQQAPGPMLADAGCTIALATDCNPGTSYFESMAPILSLAVVQMGLTVDDAIRAATLGGARSLGLDDRGLVAPGAVGDLVVLDAPSAAHLVYRPGTNLVHQTFKEGVAVA
ncbi:MAG TPA: imidazolonepropionase [Acidimicrobiia bacterium]|nr:imidazolonepropionase [Acidimicrobiia bacterium]